MNKYSLFNLIILIFLSIKRVSC